MKYKLVTAVLFALLLGACSSGNENLIVGKWSLAGRMIGGAPSSLWFKGTGVVVGPWEEHKFALQSGGVYEFVNDKRIKVVMREGYYKGNIYFFDIVKIDDKELILRNNYEDIRLKRCE